ncbi:MAG: FG-GAP-like repeat-containing protein [Planctomycetota bacterium]
MRSSRPKRHALSSALAALGASAADAQDARFDPRPPLSVTAPLQAFVPADVDGDGDTDVVGSDTTNGRLVWLENNGDVDPAFPIEHEIFNGVIAPNQIVAADLDNDGDTDVAAAVTVGTGQLVWFENLGGVPPAFEVRSLGQRPNLESSGVIRSLAVGDLQGDGHLDVVCGFELPSGAASGHVTAYISDGTVPPAFLRFQLNSPASALSEVTGLAIADLTGDGSLDIAACSREPAAAGDADSIVAWRSTAPFGIGFIPAVVADGLGDPGGLTLARLSADGLPDIAVAAESSGEILILENDVLSPGTFLAAQPFPAAGIVDLASGQLTGSPRLDLLAATASGAVLFENQGGASVSFTASVIGPAMHPSDTIAIGPIDSDADDDVVSGGPAGVRWIERVVPIQNTTAGMVHASLQDAVLAVGPGDVLIAEPEHFVPDALVPPVAIPFELRSTGSLTIGPRADAQFDTSVRLASAPGSRISVEGRLTIAPAAQVDFESETDVEVSADQTLNNAVLTATDSPLLLKFRPQWSATEIDGAFAAAPSPLSAQPRDVRFFHPSPDVPAAIVTVSEAPGGGGSGLPGTLAVYTPSATAPNGWIGSAVDDLDIGTHRSIAVGDINGDAFDDIVSVFEPASGGQAVLRLHLCDGLSPPGFSSMSVGPAVSTGAQVVFDLDRDGAADVVTPIGFYRQIGQQSFSFVQFPLVGGDQGIGVAVARLDTDFDADVVVHTAVLGDQPPRRLGFRLVALLADGSGGFIPVEIDSLDRTGDAGCVGDCYPAVNAAITNTNTVTVSDFDRDGDDDIVLSEDRGLVIYANDSGTFVPAAAEDDLKWEESVATDADGDGSTDLVVASTRKSALIGLARPLLGQPRRFEILRPFDRAAAVAVADIDRDDDQDLVVVGSAFDRVTLLTRGPLAGLRATGAGAGIASAQSIELCQGYVAIEGSTVTSPSLHIGERGTVTGGGIITGDVTNTGILRPRPSIDVSGAYRQSDPANDSVVGSLDIVLPAAGTAPLNVSQTAALAGDLRVGTNAGSVLGPGPERVVTAGGFVPGFDRFSATLVPRLDVSISGNPESGTAVVRYNETPSEAIVDVVPFAFRDPPLIRSEFPSIGVPSDAAVGDVGGGPNGGPDGIPDLVIAYPQLRDGKNGGVAVLLGELTESGCRFLPLGVYEGKNAASPTAVEIGDFDGNGTPEIAFANRSGSPFSRLVSLLDVDSAAVVPITDSTLRSLQLRGDRVVADLAVLQLTDPASAARGPSPATLLTLTSGGIAGTVTASTYDVGSDAWDVCDIDVCDDPDSFDPIDPDGAALTLDEGFTSTSTDDDKIVVASNTGGMPDSFPIETFDAGLDPTAIRAADLTNDGFPDIAAVNETSGTVSVFVNVSDPDGPGGRSFAEGTQWSLRSDPADPDPLPTSIALADLDDDGDLDIAVVSTDGTGTRAVRSLFNLVVETGEPSFTIPENLPEQPAGTPLLVRELDAGGVGAGVALSDDLIVLTASESEGATAAESITGSRPRNGLAMNLVLCSEASVCLADVNGDGTLTPADFNAWVMAYNAGDASADQNGDGSITPADFNAWILNYNTGC